MALDRSGKRIGGSKPRQHAIPALCSDWSATCCTRTRHAHRAPDGHFQEPAGALQFRGTQSDPAALRCALARLRKLNRVRAGGPGETRVSSCRHRTLRMTVKFSGPSGRCEPAGPADFGQRGFGRTTSRVGRRGRRRCRGPERRGGASLCEGRSRGAQRAPPRPPARAGGRNEGRALEPVRHSWTKPA